MQHSTISELYGRQMGEEGEKREGGRGREGQFIPTIFSPSFSLELQILFSNPKLDVNT